MSRSTNEFSCLVAHIVAYAMNGTKLTNEEIYETIASVIADMSRVEFSDSYLDHLYDVMKARIGQPIPFMSEDGETPLQPKQKEVN